MPYVKGVISFFRSGVGFNGWEISSDSTNYASPLKQGMYNIAQVNGNSLNRLPVAREAALTTAAVAGPWAASPAPNGG